MNAYCELGLHCRSMFAMGSRGGSTISCNFAREITS